MVQNSGKTLCPGISLRRINLPEPVNVEESASGIPVSLSVSQASSPVLKPSRKQAITAVEDTWRIDDEWWRTEPVSRQYYSIRLSSGQHIVIYKDLLISQWYRQEY